MEDAKQLLSNCVAAHVVEALRTNGNRLENVAIPGFNNVNFTGPRARRRARLAPESRPRRFHHDEFTRDAVAAAVPPRRDRFEVTRADAGSHFVIEARPGQRNRAAD